MSFQKRETFLAYSKPDITDVEINAVVETLKSGWLAKGPHTKQFEEEFAAYVGAKYAIGVSSCTAALFLSLLAAGVGPGDEVITTSMTFCSTVNTIVHLGATPVFADIDPVTACIDPADIERKITSKTKAIVPVHYAGQACDLEKIYKIAKKHNLYVSEDAAHGFYTKHNGHFIGHGAKDAVCYSFYATKNLCTAEGGMLVTDREDIANKVRLCSNHGMDANAWKRYEKGGTWQYDVVEIGYKNNMYDMQAALGLSQLHRFEEMQTVREQYAQMYDKAFADLDGIEIIPIAPYTTVHCRHLYIIKVCPEKLTINRDQFVTELNQRNIGTSVHFIPVHLMTAYRETFGTKEGDLPVTESYAERNLSIPLYSKMTVEDVQSVIDAVKNIVETYHK